MLKIELETYTIFKSWFFSPNKSLFFGVFIYNKGSIFVLEFVEFVEFVELAKVWLSDLKLYLLIVSIWALIFSILSILFFPPSPSPSPSYLMFFEFS